MSVSTECYRGGMSPQQITEFSLLKRKPSCSTVPTLHGGSHVTVRAGQAGRQVRSWPRSSVQQLWVSEDANWVRVKEGTQEGALRKELKARHEKTCDPPHPSVSYENTDRMR